MLLKNIIRTNHIFHIILLVSFAGLVATGCATKKSGAGGSQEEGDEPVAEAPPALPETATIPEVAADPQQLNSGGGATASSPTSSSESAVMTGSKGSGQSQAVYYVKAGGAKLYDQPGKGRSTGALKKGDHVLVSVEGEWARIDNGKFVSMKNLSTKGIARAKSAAIWSKGSTKRAYKARKANKTPPQVNANDVAPKIAEPKAAEPVAADAAPTESPQPADSSGEEIP